VPDPESEVTADLIAELLREQHPDLADLPLTFGARGWLPSGHGQPTMPTIELIAAG
jgi:hypothetical protein